MGTVLILNLFLSGKLQDLYSKGHPYSGYPSYSMMSNMDASYMNNGSLSPPMPRTVSTSFYMFLNVNFNIVHRAIGYEMVLLARRT